MSTVQAIRCDLGGEFREPHEVTPVTVNGQDLDVCDEHAAARTVAQLLAAAGLHAAAEAGAGPEQADMTAGERGYV